VHARIAGRTAEGGRTVARRGGVMGRMIQEEERKGEGDGQVTTTIFFCRLPGRVGHELLERVVRSLSAEHMSA
jgi:hypothetical protein